MNAPATSEIRWPNTRFMISIADPRKFPPLDVPTIAVAGHSNVGKSSLLNTLFSRKGLVKTSKSPGCTRLLNLFDVDGQFVVVDLPGYGYAKASKAEQKQWAPLIEGYLGSDLGPTLVLMLLDIRHGPKESDLQLIEWMNAAGIRWQPVATKADKLTGNKRAKRLKEMCEAMGGMLKPLPTSSHDQRGINELRKLIIKELNALED